MDDLDREILALLRQDSRTPYTEIGDMLDVSEGTVRNRVDRLLENGTIERFTIATRTGNVKSMVEVSVAVDVDTQALAERMAEWTEVDFVWQVSGEEDMVLIVDAMDTERVNELITRTREQAEVRSTKTRLILEETRG
ncbi:AsnC family transcriptional regulator [Halodesulfurarchaeum formicicum]|uniref:AsnC family transcriptional regulator n=1 Tax=Halodesulfurarchaeum formicicum TaxID=1873524 RepID=A0A1D8S2A5_9EURY|nr:Lrp/AsnC family transcriptional regulator [Halodesulfurarchaeum formicicum]AOW79494.1 AsnC family transcriptional regulator [Halodesulfurarchaeum formicicum]APE94746.1 AsnC family transcriptional regulator [Halodesulfurarchaeum formicicum]